MSIASDLAAEAKANFDSAPGHALGFATNSRDVKGTVLLALHQPHMARVLAIPAAEWNAFEAARLLGIEQRPWTAQEMLAMVKPK